MQGRIDYPDGIFVQPFRHAFCYVYIALLRNDIDVREKTLLTYLEVHLLLDATDVLICTRHCIKRQLYSVCDRSLTREDLNKD